MPGFFCPAGTGNLVPSLACSSPTSYCPLGSASPLNTSVGWYALSTSAVARLFFNQSVCEEGRYCVGGVASFCPAGRYGNTTGADSADCSGQCTAGYYCPLGSTLPTQTTCGDATVYCPQVCPPYAVHICTLFPTPTLHVCNVRRHVSGITVEGARLSGLLHTARRRR